MKQNDKGINQSTSKRATFVQTMRKVSVFTVTIWLFVLINISLSANEWHLFMWLILTVMFSFITLPILGFWIYSFIRAIMKRTKTDNILLLFHIADLLLLGAAIYFSSRVCVDCNADIMAEHYEMEGGWMRDIANCTRQELPDSTRLVVEFGEDEYIPQANYLDGQYIKILKNRLCDVDCLGIEIDNYQLSKYTTFRFRRKGMGMYSFRLYDEPLTGEQQDSLNANDCLIVYNDSTVFEFRGGVKGVQYFVGKQEFVDKLNKAAQ